MAIFEQSGTAVASQALCNPEKLHTYVKSLGVREEVTGVCIDYDRAHKRGSKPTRAACLLGSRRGS